MVPIALGFVLTTIIGGVFASFLQQRAWRHQNAERLRQEDLGRASDVCRTTSALVDKRAYRMQRLLWSVTGYAEGRVALELLESRLVEYDSTLVEWNDELNSRLAVVGAYFGRDIRDFVDTTVYPAFAQAGGRLELLVRAARTGAEHLDSDEIAAARAELVALNSAAYRLGFAMMVRIRQGRVGRHAVGLLDEIDLNAG
ncbi:hypothetical protein [Nocardia rhizosphaerihabitans]|uniref:hypothetical protein n=1 Tax=Nocardia rhizosphaerihabitans TaxID=1691570 RepID=UPI00166CF5BE|nr:hypothetical protein [Nocardia rhizosphaerihabitans]